MKHRIGHEAALAQSLSEGQVHVWISRTDLPRSAVAACWATLSNEEMRRSRLFRFRGRRQQFIASHGLLRIILARYTGQRANELSFCLDSSGKPRLGHGGQYPRIQFNLSHSGSLCAIAVTGLEMVGVDVEEARAEIDPERVARRIFTRREWAEFDRLSAAERSAWFYRAWSKKEAFVKAIGVGMSMPFQEVEIAELWQTRSGSPFLKQDRSEFCTWWSQSFVPAPGYVGAVATLGTPSSILYRWEGHK